VEFITRLPVVGSSRVGPWLFVANPYVERDELPSSNDSGLMQRLHRLLDEYLERKETLTKAEPDLIAATLTRRLKPDRDSLKQKILDSSKAHGLTSGKVHSLPLLFILSTYIINLSG
jgi:hypothetical protein